LIGLVCINIAVKLNETTKLDNKELEMLGGYTNAQIVEMEYIVVNELGYNFNLVSELPITYYYIFK